MGIRTTLALLMILTVPACTSASPRPSQPPTPSRREPPPSPGTSGPPPPTGLTGRIAYSTPAGDIWVMDAGGSNRNRVTNAGGNDFAPSFSPDGKRIVFRTSRGTYLPDATGTGVEGIFVVGSDGRGEHPVHPVRGGLFPDWSPAASRIAMSTITAAGSETIITTDPNGGHLRDLRVSGECSEWSPDGSKIAYCHQTYGADRFDIYVMNADGSGRRQLTASPGDDNPGAWSPDGRRIAFSSQRDGNYNVFVMDADGSNVHRLTSDPRPEAAAAWLKDGRIVFARFVDEGPAPNWFVVHADGSNVRSLPWLKGAADPLDWIQP